MHTGPGFVRDLKVDLFLVESQWKLGRWDWMPFGNFQKLPGCSILDDLQSIKQTVRKTKVKRVGIIQSWGDQKLYHRFAGGNHKNSNYLLRFLSVMKQAHTTWLTWLPKMRLWLKMIPRFLWSGSWNGSISEISQSTGRRPLRSTVTKYQKLSLITIELKTVAVYPFDTVHNVCTDFVLCEGEILRNRNNDLRIFLKTSS